MGGGDGDKIEFVSTSRSRRGTAGKRMNKLIGEAIEEDNSFWSHDIFNEEDNEDFSSDDCESDAALDSADSDFDAPEEADDPDDEKMEEKAVRTEERSSARRKARQTSSYVDPASKRPRRKKPTASTSTLKPLTNASSMEEAITELSSSVGKAEAGAEGGNTVGRKRKRGGAAAVAPSDAPIEFVSTARSRRATAGKRMNKLIGEAIEEDNSFWSHGIFNDEDNEDFSSEDCDSEADSADSDFDKSESSEDEEENAKEEKQVRKAERVEGQKQARASAAYVDPNNKQRSRRSTKPSADGGVDALGNAAATGAGNESTSDDRQPRRRAQSKDLPPSVSRKSVRSSTVQSTDATNKAKIKEQKAREKLEKKREKMKGKGEKKGERRLTQEDLLAEAALTEQYNIAYLAELRRHEDEEKKREERVLAERTDVYYTYKSRDGVNTLTFKNTDTIPPPINQHPVGRPKPSYCVITGLPARYLDPRTGKPYANAAAFAALHRRVRQ